MEKACFGPKQPDQPEVLIPPGTTVEWGFEITAHSSGPFEDPIKLFLDDNGLRKIELVVRGTGAEPKGVGNGTAERR